MLSSAKPKQLARAAINALAQLERWAASLGIILIAMAVVGDVVAREAGLGGIRGASNIAVLTLIAVGFVGLAVAADRGSHLRVKALDIPWGRYEPLFTRLGHFVTGTLLVAFAYIGVSFVRETYELNEHTVILEVPLWWAQLFIPYAFLSHGIRCLAFSAFPDLAPTGRDLE